MAPTTDLTDLYFEDLRVGRTFVTPSVKVTDSMIAQFGHLTGDNHPFHCDDDLAASGPFGRRVAHGLLSLSILQGLMVATGYDRQTGEATLGWDQISFPAPVFPGDVVHARFTIKSARESRSRPRSGVIVEECLLLNQNDDVVVRGDHCLLLRRREG